MRQGSSISTTLVLIVAATVLPLSDAQATMCFVRSQTTSIPVLEAAPPPLQVETDYPYYPVSISATAQLETLSRARPATVKGAYWAWANHGPRDQDGGSKGNITPGSYNVQIRFSGIGKANHCTKLQTQALLGLPLKDNGKLRLETDTQTADTMDVCVLPKHKLDNASAILLDYEVQDGRTAEQTTAFLISWANMVRAAGFSPILYANPWNAPTQKWTGLNTSNSAQIVAAFDYVGITLWSGAAVRDFRTNFQQQMQIAALTPKKTMIVFELMGTTVDDARAVHDLVAGGKAGVLAFWRNGAQTGGACTTPVNQKIACAAFGKCP